METEFTISEIFNVSAESLYKAWLSTEGHTLMTRSPAKVDGREGGDFTAWDGYIWGTFQELEENKKIAQSWRTSEFPEEADDSMVEILLREENGKTTITLTHTHIPAGQADDYRKGWDDFYFKPMKEYFG